MQNPRPFTLAGLVGLALFVLAAGAQFQQRPADRPRQREGNLQVGQAAPDFTVPDVDGRKTVKLNDLKGKPVVLIFGSCT